MPKRWRCACGGLWAEHATVFENERERAWWAHHALAHAGNRTPARAEEMHRSPIGPGGSIATLANAAALRVLAVR